MTIEEINEIADEFDEEMLYPSGYEAAIIGLSYNNDIPVFVLDEDKIIEVMRGEGMDYDEAFDNYSYNMVRSLAYLGDNKPIIMKVF